MNQEEFVKKLKAAMKEGKLSMGTESTLDKVRRGEAGLVAVASNSPRREEIERHAEGREVEVFEFQGDSIALGKLCKRPFGVAALAISE